MKTTINKKRRLCRRRARVRAKIKVTKEAPRLSVYRSLNHIYAQIIDDERGLTLASASDREIVQSAPGKKSLSKKDLAFKVGELIASAAIKKKIRKVVFDRGGRIYHGRVEAVACGSRKGGLQF